MATFKPEVNYKNLIKHNTKCSNQNCGVQLDSSNFGEKINEDRGYLRGNFYVLSPYGFFCNACSPLAVKELDRIRGGK